ncbi:hypothetical protein [Paenibacillus sp. HB172176]|uniref:hypothetical protein n=1 Tax=Paenibacillus sp. HB172176 TaxID=2493690 RepID=UPI001439CC7F|nr:hypothetical protein [Paenibacillus sp. HB172176]
MQLNRFAFGLQNNMNEVRQPLMRLSMTNTLVRSTANSLFSTSSLLKPQQPAIIIHNSLGAVGVEEYQANSENLRQQAILRAATSAIHISRNEDGTVLLDRESISDPMAALDKKRATGGEAEISWQHIGVNLQRHEMLFGEDSLDEAAFNIDYFASEYAQYKTRIERQYSGDQKIEELAKLDQLFTLRVGESAEHFAETVGGFMESSGVSGEQEALQNSFLDVYEQRKATYLQFIESNSDYANVKGTADEWLLTSGDFMGEQLRYALISEQPEMNITSEYGYSVDELQAAGTMVKELAKVQDRSMSSDRSEEEFGTQLGLAAMKYELISNHFTMSDRVRSKLDQAFNGFLGGEIERISTYIDQQRSDPFVRNKEAYAVNYDKNAVLEIVKRMVDNLSADDVNAAFRTDWNSVVSLYKSKMQNVQSGDLARYDNYYSSWVNENYASDWNRFVQQLSTSNNNDLSRYKLLDQLKWLDVKV